jgi:hypothetical protein
MDGPLQNVPSTGLTRSYEDSLKLDPCGAHVGRTWELTWDHLQHVTAVIYVFPGCPITRSLCS